MKPRFLPRIILIAAALAAVVLVWTWPTGNAGTDSQPESMESADGHAVSAEKLSWETLPHQLFSSF